MIKFKDDYAKEGFSKLHPILVDIINQVNKWSEDYDKNSITLTATLSTPELDKKLDRVSPAHSQARAVDIRTIDMTRAKLILLMQTFTEKYKHLGYLTQKNERRLMFYHNNGNGPHIHLAIGIDIIEKYKSLYPNWNYPVNKTVKKENKNA